MGLASLTTCKVVPVVTAVDVASTVQLAKALQRGGIKVIEITMRSDCALASIQAVRTQVPGLLVAAGTVTNSEALTQVKKAGAELVFSPGCSDSLLRAATAAGVDFIPGVCSASEIMLCLDHGFECLKLFPAEAAGGRSLLKAFSGPFPQVRFCPTGGLDEENFRAYLEMPNVVCCGGSWMVTSTLVSNGQWDEIERLAREAMA